MARIGGAPLPTITDDRALGAADIQRSLRFNRDDSGWLSRALGSPTSDDKASVSVWLKRTDISTDNTFFDNYQGTNDRLSISLLSSTDGDALSVYQRDSSGIVCLLTTTQKFRDPTSWFHILVAFDTTQGTEADRVKIYVNGTQVTSFSSSTYFSQNHNLRAGSGYTTNVGRYGAGSNYFGGYMAEFNYIDGQQLSPTDVGFTDSQTGIWMPKRYEGSYGNNGFRLDFSDNSSTTALGIDKSPNGNDFTTNNFSVSAGVGNDSLEDTPTNNFCTLNKLNTIKYNANYDTLLEEGGLLMRGGDNVAPATMLYPKSGKWYCEFSKYGNGYSQGVSVVRADTDIRNLDGVTSHSSKVTITTYVELLVRGSSVSNNGTTWENDADAVIGVAVDMDNGAMYFAINNTWINSGVPTSGSAKTNAVATDLLTVNDGYHYVAPQGYNGNDNAGMYANFGQRPFTYTPPSGYKTLCAKNLPKPTTSIINPDQHFKTLLYTGTGSSNIVEGLKFQPDLVWVKGRDTNGYEPMMIDSVRGGDNSLVTSDTASESTHGGRSMTFYNRGVRWNSDSGNCNANGENYVLWCWKGGGTAVSNNDGSVTSTISANQEAGFSIVQFESQSSGSITVGHGLGRKPAFWMWKSIDNTIDWYNYHKGIGYDGWINLSTTSQATTGNAAAWGAEPTSTVLTHGSGLVNQNTIMMYVWAEIPGFSRFGRYVGNGNTNGPFVYCGFRPAFVLTKMIDTMNENWTINDSSRSTYNPVDLFLRPDEAVKDTSGAATMDFSAEGFKLRNTDSKTNRDGGTFIYMAFAEQPGTTPFETFANAR